MKKRLFGILLSFALMLTMMPVLGLSLTAYAGTETYTKLMNDKTVVIFNNYNWYIIADNSTAVDDGTVTLLAADASFGMSAFDSTSPSSNAYSGSTVKGVLDALTEEGGAFASLKDAIADTNLNDVGVNGAKLYLLSTSEAGPYAAFNFEGAQYGGWWLRSPGHSNDEAAFVFGESGTVMENGNWVGKQYGVRPALKLDLSKVVFDSSTNTFSIPTPYPLWVGGTQVTSANTGNILGNQTASYVAESNTLTLNGATITTGQMVENYKTGICYNGSKLLNIVLADGSVNTVEIAGGGVPGIGICENTLERDHASGLKISGKGRLTASGSVYGIYANNNITIEDCDVKASGDSGIRSYWGNIEIKAGSKVTASGDDQAISCYEGTVKNAIAGTGWSDAAGTKDETAIEASTTGQDLSSYKKVQFPVMFTVTFVDGQGKTLKTEEVASGTAATAPADPTRDGYTFKGWDKDFSNVTEDMTVIALWEKKADPTPAANPLTVTTTAKTSARSMTVKWTWNNVPGAKSYKVSYHKVGSKKWTTKTTKKTKYVVKGHKMKGLYEYKVAAVTASGDVWSNTSCRYFKGVKTKAKAGKAAGTVRASWKKDKGATGYQVKLATNKNLNGAQVVNVSADKKSYTFSGLKSGKKYYVSVRPLKDHNGVTYQGIRCKALKVKTK